MSNRCDFDKILKNECYLHHFTRNLRIKNLDDFERDKAGAYLWRAGLLILNVKEKVMTICYILNRQPFCRQCKAIFLLEADSLY